MPLISVLMPMKNMERYVQKALASVLAQEGIDLEVLVCDDASTDRSVAIVNGMDDPRIRLLRNPGQGIASGLNHCLQEAVGDIVARCDADDLYTAGRLQRQVTLLDLHPECGAVCGIFQAIDDDDRPIVDFDAAHSAYEVSGEIRKGTVRIHLNTFATRTELLREIGGARPFFVAAEDIDIQYRLAEKAAIWYVPEVFYLYRLQANSVIHSQPSDFVMFFVNAAGTFHEQRAAGQLDDLQRGEPPEPPPNPRGKVLTARRHESDLLTGAAWKAHKEGHKADALRLGMRALIATPLRAATWKSFLALVLKCPKTPPPEDA